MTFLFLGQYLIQFLPLYADFESFVYGLDSVCLLAQVIFCTTPAERLFSPLAVTTQHHLSEESDILVA